MDAQEKKCCMEGCQRTGTPEPGDDFYVCTECLENLERLVNEEWAKALDAKLGRGWRN